MGIIFVWLTARAVIPGLSFGSLQSEMIHLVFVTIAHCTFIQGSNGTSFDVSTCGVSDGIIYWPTSDFYRPKSLKRNKIIPKSASCLANIPNCRLGEDNCAHVSWKMNGVDVDISLAYKGIQTYVGFALGAIDRNTINGEMSYTDIYYCQNRRSSGLGVESAWARYNSKLRLSIKYSS